MIRLRYRAGATGSAYPYKRKVEGSTPGASKIYFFRLSLFFIFLNFLNCALTKHMFPILFIRISLFSKQKSAFEKQITEAQRLSIL